MNFQYSVLWLINTILGLDQAAAPPTTDSHPWLFTPAPPPTQSTPLPDSPPSPAPSFTSTSVTYASANLLTAYCDTFLNNESSKSPTPRIFLIFAAIFLLVGMLFIIFVASSSAMAGHSAIIDGNGTRHEQAKPARSIDNVTAKDDPTGERETTLNDSSGTIADKNFLGLSVITSIETLPADPPAPIDNKLSMSEIMSVETVPVDTTPQSDLALAVKPTVEFGFSAISSVETVPADTVPVSSPAGSTSAHPAAGEPDEELDRQVRAAYKVIQDKVQSFLERYTKFREHFNDAIVPDLTEDGIRQADTITAGFKAKRSKNKGAVRDFGAKQHKLLLALAGHESRPCDAWCDKCGQGVILPGEHINAYRCDFCAKKHAQTNVEQANSRRREENKAKTEALQNAAAGRKQQIQQQQSQAQKGKGKGKGKQKA